MDIVFETERQLPLIRVCALKKQPHIDIKFNPDDYMLLDSEGSQLFPDIKHEVLWRAKVKKGKSAQYEYYLVLNESQNPSLLRKKLEEYRKTDKLAFIKKVGGDSYIGDKLVASNEKHLIMVGPFLSESKAALHARKYNKFKHMRIHKTLLKPGKGTIELYDAEYENFTEIINSFQLKPKNAQAFFQVKHYAIAEQGTEKPKHKDLLYQGVFNIEIDEQNTLTAVNKLSVEDYIKGVLYSELGDPIQLEYAKSMAIIARSQVFSRIGQCHVNEGFDFCSDSHCLRYYGNNFKIPEIEQAVEKTKGLILMLDGEVCQSYFHYSCGGHTENTSGICLDDDLKYIHGKFDGNAAQKIKLDLRREEDVKSWIESKPEVNCRIDEQTMNSSHKLSLDSFRWEVFYTRDELQDILRRKLAEDVGLIYDIIPLSRGVSGRIKEVEILGSLKNIRVAGELNIRAVFSETYLNSTCFIIKSELDMDGVPMNFNFIGAGMGHGVGLCKVGATRMACNNKTHRDIIGHYFEECEIKRIY